MLPLIRIVVESEDTLEMGLLCPPKDMTQTQANKILEQLWQEWRLAVPEPDNFEEFTDWLVTQKGWTRPEIRTMTVYIPDNT